MFKDYYSILEIDSNASAEDIKSAYRRLSKKWHPDVNPNVDMTYMMQDINEAYYILKNEEKRHRYDEEYNRFKYFRQTSINQMRNNHSSAYARSSSKSYYYDYTVRDEKVWNDMETARTEAIKLVKEFLNNLKKDAQKAAKGAWEEIYSYLIICIIFIIIGFIIHSLY